MYSTPSRSDLLRSFNQNADLVVARRAADVAIEVARDEEERAARATYAKANARRNSSLKIVKEFRATLVRFEREVASTDASDDVLRLANAADATLRAGGTPEGLTAIIGEMYALLG